MIKRIQSLSVIFLKALSRLPFSVLYLISDMLYPLLFYIVGYRKKVVYENLRNSFPEKSRQEIDRIAKRFYRHFCDLILESVKLPGMSDKDLDERLIVHGLDKINAYAAEGKSMVSIGMHYNNWEWSSTIQRITDTQILIVYHPLQNNEPMDRYMKEMRERFGSMAVSMEQSGRLALKLKNSGKSFCLFLAADQTPTRQSHFWTTFLNQETAFFSGPERIAIKTNQPVFLHYTRKTGRGKYEVEMTELFPEPSEVSPDTILLAYADRMEKIIRETPEYWLWSHRRWKHRRPEGVPLVPRHSEVSQEGESM